MQKKDKKKSKIWQTVFFFCQKQENGKKKRKTGKKKKKKNEKKKKTVKLKKKNDNFFLANFLVRLHTTSLEYHIIFPEESYRNQSMWYYSCDYHKRFLKSIINVKI